MLGRLSRQWRRLLVGMALLIVSLALYWTLHGAPDDVRFNAIFAMSVVLAALIVVGAAIAALSLVAPGSLPLVELLLITLILCVPLTYVRHQLGIPAWTDCILLGAMIVLTERVLYGDWGQGLMRRDSGPHVTRFTVPLPTDEVWKRIVPLPEHAASYFRPATDFLPAPEGSDADFILHAKRRWGLKDSVEAIHIEEYDGHSRFCYRAEPSQGSTLPAERIGIRLTPQGDGTRVEMSTTFLNAPLGTRLRLWLGRDAWDYTASVRNRLTGRRDGTVHGRQIAPV